MALDPLKVEIMDIGGRIRADNILQVTSQFVREPSSTNLHPDGLFSERIFGELASPERISQFGYIDLRTEVIHPRLFKTLMRLKGLYNDVIEGKAYAVFDKVDKDFIASDESEDNAGTGYSFFMAHLDELVYTETESITRSTKIQVLKKYKDRMRISKYLVIPAGLRDIKLEATGSTSEEINKLYSGLLRLTSALPLDRSENPMYDAVRIGIQTKCVAIYEYIQNITDGKTGFFQKKYGARAVALATRNVISAADTNSQTPEDAQAIKSGETMMPLFQGMKAFEPFVLYHLKSVFLNSVMTDGAAQVSVIDPKTLQLTYIEVNTTEKDKYMTSTGIGSLINSYRDVETRHHPVTIKDINDKPHYLYLVYEDGNDRYLVRSAADLKELFAQRGITYDPSKIHPLTRAEMFYIATYLATDGRHCSITRYPITGAESVYPSKVHLISTTESDKVVMKLATTDQVLVELPHFPVRGSVSTDSIVLHPSQLANLGGDHDGDTVSVTGILADESNDEVAKYLESPASVVGVDGKLNVGMSTDLAKLTFHNLSRIP